MTRGRGNFLIAQGGGPTAVINATLTGAALEAIQRMDGASQVWGARGGIAGLLEENFLDLRRLAPGIWSEILRAPAAALGSSRKSLTRDDLFRAAEICRNHDIRFFLSVGGNGSLKGASRISRAAREAGYEMHVVGLPKTIDNDLNETDFCPGYGSCARFYGQAVIDLAADVSSLPTPVSIFETMGRDSGWLSASTMLARKDPADAPHLIYVPEIPVSRDKFLRDIEEAYDRQGWVVAVVPEGLRDENSKSLGSEEGVPRDEEFGQGVPCDVAPALARLVTSRLGLRARSEKPGLMARASSHHVSSVDREAAEGTGRFAVQHALEGNRDFMVAIRREENKPFRFSFLGVPLERATSSHRPFPERYVNADRNNITESFRDYAEPLIGEPLRHYPRLGG